MSVKKAKARPKQRFAVGAEVRVKLPGLTGIVTQMDSSPTVLGEYWHTIHTQLGDRKEPGSILDLIPTPMTNAKPQELSIPITDEGLLSPDKAISLLRDRLDEAVEHLHHNDPEVDSWERVLQKIVERAFGEHSRNAKHFVVTLSKARQSDDERQAWHVDHIREKKECSVASSGNLKIIPPHHLQSQDHDHSLLQDHRFAKLAVEEARISAAEDQRPHPMVGCVVVKNGQIIATSHRGEMKANHAEFIALEKKLSDVTL